MSRRTLKRACRSGRLEVSSPRNVAFDTSKEKRRKLGTKPSNVKTSENKPDKKSVKDSSESSSDEFEQSPPELKFDSSDVKEQTVISNFTTIENSILKGVTRLSESDDSEFGDGILSTQVFSVKSDNCQNGTLFTKIHEKYESNSVKTSKNRDNLSKHGSKGKDKGKSRQNKSNTLLATKKNDSKTSPVDINKMDVSQLLALGEGSSTNLPSLKTGNKSCNSESDTENDWEDVEGLDTKPEKHTIPQEGVEVRLEIPDIYSKRKKKSFDMESHLRRRLNRVKRELQILIHKVHLLCWVAHGRYVNAVLNSEVLMGISLSLIPSQHCLPQKLANLSYLEQIVKWFSKTVSLDETRVENTPEPLLDSLQSQFQRKIASSTRDLVLMFICLLRAIGMKVRLILSFQPLPLKPSSDELLGNRPRSKGRCLSALSETKGFETKIKSEDAEADNESSTSDKSAKKKNDKQGNETLKKSEETKSAKKLQKGSTDSSKKKTKSPKINVTNKTADKSNLTDYKMEKLKRTLRDRKEIANKYKEHSSGSDENEKGKSDKAMENNKSANWPNSKNNNKKSPSTSVAQQSSAKMGKSVIHGSKRKSSKKDNRKTSQNNSDSDFEPVLKKQIENEASSDSENDFEPKKIVPKRTALGKTVDRRVLSSDSSSGDTKKRKDKKYIDVWTEVFLEEEEKWISVDVSTARVHCITELHSKATQPVTYVIGFSNDLTLKDVTCRYCAQYSTATRKLRVDEDWWNQSLKPFLGARTAHDREEDEELNRLMLDRPLPTTFKELKSHPLYALRDDLLKFEAIYPPDAPPLGYIKGKPIYARECVHVLHSREAWIKEAKVVRVGEKPYKIVKARPKYDKMTGQFVKDLPLEVFGSWQVEDYIPPLAVDGKVPRNEYGNVELFKPCMLPKGTVHLPITGLNRVARKLGIDCAPAMIGFDFHAGGTHPVFDGFIICEEFKDILLDAWNQEQDEAVKRQQEKLEKRVYGNWRRLIKGLLIRERLKLRYSFGEEAGPSEPRLLSSINESNKLLSVIDSSLRNKTKGNVNRNRKSNNVSRSSGDSRMDKKRVMLKKRKLKSEEEEEVSESDEEEDFDSDKDWD